MQTTLLKILGATLIAATTIQVADATEHQARKARAPAIEQFRNSNAYAGTRDNAAQSNWSSLDEGAMASGIAGH